MLGFAGHFQRLPGDPTVFVKNKNKNVCKLIVQIPIDVNACTQWINFFGSYIKAEQVIGKKRNFLRRMSLLD